MMESVWPDSHFSVVLSLAVAGPLLGLARWLNWSRIGGCLASLLGAWALAALVFKQPAMAWAPPAGVAAAYFLAVAVQRYHASFAQAISSRRVQGVALLIAGPLLVSAWAVYLDSSTPITEFPPDEPVPAAAAPEPVPTSKLALTDRGRAIRLYTRSFIDKSEVARIEKEAKRIFSLDFIRVSEPDSVCNCHGWIFTNGQYWVPTEKVDLILADNDYHKVEYPRVTDLIIYRDSLGQIVHSGLVRLADDNLVLVESKWGHSGRYLHRPADQTYSTVWDFYRSHRQGHLLPVREDGSASATSGN
jgi:hypothetical protein